MAPIQKNSDSVEFRRSQNFWEGNWEFTGSEHQSDESVEGSEAPIDGRGGLEYGGNPDMETPHTPLEVPTKHDDVLHPLRETANRVGREIERFAEALDGYNPLKAHNNAERYELALELIEMYYGIACETVKRLRDQHATGRREQHGMKYGGEKNEFKIIQDSEAMETDDLDSGNLASFSFSTTVEDLKRWEEEAQTWDILLRIIKLQYFQESNDNSKKMSKPIHRYSSEKEVWSTFLDSNSLARERNTILKWLKDTADESGDDIDVLVHDLQQNAERGDIIAHGWLHTKAAIKNQKRIHTWPQDLDPFSADVQRVLLNSSKSEPLVTQLDPDAPTRQSRSLEIQDQYFERAVWLGCYEMLRRGKSMRDIKEWCRDRTEIWKAVSMSAFPGADIDDSDNSSDCISSALWRRMCFALAKGGTVDKYERAVYGILSGDVSTVEPVCRSWGDHMFAHYNALVCSQFENYLRIHYPSRVPMDALQRFDTFDAIQFHGEPETAGERILNSLKEVPRLKAETARPMKVLQGILIAKKFEDFIFRQGLWLSKLANAENDSNLIPKLKINTEDGDTTTYVDIRDHDSLRVLVHTLLALKTFGIDLERPSRRLVIENVVVAYIDFLRLAGKEELIPLYCSQLSGNRVYATLSRVLVDVTDPVQRETQIRLMKNLGLDVQQFARFQTMFLFQDFPDVCDGYPADGKFRLLEGNSRDDLLNDALNCKVRPSFVGDDIARIDLLLIRSLEWHMLVDGLWTETLRTGVLIYKRFFKHLKFDAAKALSDIVPCSRVSITKTRALLGESLDLMNLDIDENDYVTEQLDGLSDHKKLLKRHMLAEAKTYRDLEILIKFLSALSATSETICSMQTSRTATANQRRELNSHLQMLKPQFQLLLQGWLLSSQREDSELVLLRETYLPEIILAYNRVLHFSGLALSYDNLLECMDLSTILAAEEFDFVDLFMKKGRMEELVSAFARNSKALLCTDIDQKSKPGRNSKRIRKLGWNRELWNIKP